MPLRHRPLPGDGRVAFAAEACIAARSLPSACPRCAQACPAGAVRVGEAGPELVADCLGCGRCAAACPTGALTLEGFSGTVTLPPGNAPLRIECWKVPAALCGQDVLRVPCLCGIGGERLVEWLALLDGRAIRLVDRTWCAYCSAGGSDFPAQVDIDAANALLAACGIGSGIERIARLEAPLPPALMPAGIPEPATQAALSRRDFFRRFAAETAQAIPAPPPATPRRPRGSDFPLPKRERFLAALSALTRQPVERLPGAVLPGLTLAAGCDHLGVCAGMCPTGALHLYEEGGHAGAAFAPRDCVACGLCAQSCPARAIEVRPAGSPEQKAAEQILTSFPLVRCEHCQTLFAATQGASLCPACRRSRAMAKNLFGTRFAVAQTNQ
jgi:ferredoxin